MYDIADIKCLFVFVLVSSYFLVFLCFIKSGFLVWTNMFLFIGFLEIQFANFKDLECAGMGWNWLEWAGMGWNGLEWAGIGWNGLELVGMGWNGLEYAGIGWNELKWAGMG